MQDNSRIVSALARREEDATLQKQIGNQGNYVKESFVDYKLAMYFHNFLMGVSNKLPSYEFIDKVIALNDQESRLQVISMGYGLSVYIYGEKSKRYIVLENTTRVSNSVERIDKISFNSHFAYTLDFSGHVESLDVEEFPIFKKERIIYLQKHLNNYRLNNMNSVDNKNVK